MGASFQWVWVNSISFSGPKWPQLWEGTDCCPRHGYGMVLSLAFAEHQAEVLNPLLWPWEPQTSRTSASGGAAWPAGQAALVQQASMVLTLVLASCRGVRNSTSPDPSGHPLLQPGGTNCSLLCVLFVPAAIKSLMSVLNTSLPLPGQSFYCFVCSRFYATSKSSLKWT